MKKNISLATIILSATTIFIAVSCTKEDNIPTASNSHHASKQPYQPPQVDDMLAYLMDFKQKIQSRGNDETMTLDEAAWHLSSLVNYDYGDVTRDLSDLRYDTLYTQVSVSNGTVSLSDLNTAYNNIAGMVDDFYQNLDLENASPRFIDVGIDETGTVTISLITSYGDWWIYAYFFPNIYDEDSVLNVLGIHYDTCFSLEDEFPDELKRVLNIQSVLITAYGQDPSDRVFCIPSRTDTLAYNAYPDPNGSPFLSNYMIMNYIAHEPEVCYDELAYCFDRYAYAAMQSLASNEVVISWIELPIKHYYNPFGIAYQCPKIKYGIPIAIPDNPQD